MWIAFIAGWLIGSISLYGYMVFTAKEPERDECFDCQLDRCEECPHQAISHEELRRAA